MNLWCLNSTWQNFSSHCREANAALLAPNEMSKYHHLTSSLYFGVSTIESFLNQQMRQLLSDAKKSEDEIFKTLRRPGFRDKLKNWPGELASGVDLIPQHIKDSILSFADIRDNLTHPKSHLRDIYASLDVLNPNDVTLTVCEYCIRIIEAQGNIYPYWFFGWNYFNPRPNTQEIWIINEQQFLHSLNHIGFNVPSFDYGRAEQWKRQYMSSYDGFLIIKAELDKLKSCEPKNPRFPFQPTLCKEWWNPEHFEMCGRSNFPGSEFAQ